MMKRLFRFGVPVPVVLGLILAALAANGVTSGVALKPLPGEELDRTPGMIALKPADSGDEHPVLSRVPADPDRIPDAVAKKPDSGAEHPVLSRVPAEEEATFAFEGAEQPDRTLGVTAKKPDGGDEHPVLSLKPADGGDEHPVLSLKPADGGDEHPVLSLKPQEGPDASLNASL